MIPVVSLCVHDCVEYYDCIFLYIVGSDFGFLSTIFTVTFAAGVENVLAHTQIPIVDDTIAEETEMFTASLTSTDQSVQISDGTATVHILDNDSEH